MKFADAINEVRNRINIVDVIGRSVRLKRSGNNYMGLCPFHNEKTPSFVVSETKQIFKCFGCGKGGNVYNFLMEHGGMTFPEAVKSLASQVNVIIDDDFKNNDEFTKKRDLMYKLYKDVANEYYKILYTADGKTGLSYLTNRKLTKETIKKFGLGFSLKSYGYMYKIMKDKGYDDSILMDSKLFYTSDNGPYDFFYNRVMFPLVDSFGNIVSFQGRVLEGDTQKYINTSESIIYKKSKHLFGINYAKLTHKDYYILCEGNMDVITLHQAGFDNAIASWGTAFTIEQANLIKRKVRKVYLCQDSDSAGLKAIGASTKICDDAGIETYVLDLYPAKDPDEFINKYGKDAFENKLKSPMPSFLFLISVLKKQLDLRNTYDYTKYIETIIKRLSKFENRLVREKYIKDVAVQENLSYEDLIRQVDKYISSNGHTFDDSFKSADIYKNSKTEISDITYIERKFVSTIIDNAEYKDKIIKHISINDIHDKASSYIYEKYIEGKSATEISDISFELPSDIKEEVHSIIFSTNSSIFDTDKKDEFKKNLNELIRKIKKSNLKTETADLKTTLLNNQKSLEIDNTIYIE